MKNKYNKYFIISGTLALVIIFSFLIVEIYTRTLEDSKRDYQQQQLEMTKIAAHGINFYLDHLINDITFLSSVIQSNDLKTDSISYLQNYINDAGDNPVQSIFKADKDGNIVFVVGKSIPYWTSQYLNDHSYSTELKGNIFLSKVDKYQNSIKDFNLVFHLVSDMTNDKKGRGSYIGFIINFNILINEYIKPLKLSREDFAWVIDGQGRLIYHPNHKEMLLHSIESTSNKCFDCHSGFEKQHTMLSANIPSTGEYKVINGESPKVMAYYPIIIKNQKWVLVISTMVTKVTQGLRERFKVFFIIGVVILSFILFFSFLIYYLNSKRIRAEESRRNLEKIHEYKDQLDQASKLASIGELVDSVAHEINTPAGIIAAHLDGLTLQLKIPDEIIPEVNIIKKQIKRITDYTRTLLNYSHRMEFNPESVDLKELVEECIYILSPKFRSKKIKIERLFNDCPLIKADQGQLQQVIINLLINAADSIDHSGIIKVSINRFSKDNADLGVITIEDNGSGIPKENIEKIFNAFFSTKQKDKGTGLGLYISKAIIQRHKGNITVNPSTSGGAIFEITLPINGPEES